MPIGAPKVAYRFGDDDENGSWLDLYNRLYFQRILFLGQEIDVETSNQLVGLMVYLSIEDKTRDIFLFINSPGGDVLSGMALFDGINFVAAEVQTICLGIAASMASVVLAGGQTTKRTALPHARVMIHQPVGDLQDGKSGDGLLDLKDITKMYDNIIDVYAKRTGKPASQISEDMSRRDLFMTPEEAKAYGIIDDIAQGLR